MMIPPARRPRVLVVDDDEALRRLVARLLAGCEVRTAADGADGLDCVRRERFDLVLLDLAMPRMDGMALLETARRENPNLYVVILTGNGEIADLKRALELGARACLTKPFTAEQLADVVACTSSAAAPRDAPPWRHAPAG